MGCVTDRLSVASIIFDNGAKQASAAMRKSLNGLNSPGRVTSTIGLLLKPRPDPTDFKLAFNVCLGPDVAETSGADLGVYGHDWGNTIGSLDAVRIPARMKLSPAQPQCDFQVSETRRTANSGSVQSIAWQWSDNLHWTINAYSDRQERELWTQPISVHSGKGKDHNFVATKAQYIRKLGNWNMKKNITQDNWKKAAKMITKRKREGKDTNIAVRGAQSYGPAGASPQPSPSAIAAVTPTDLSSKTVLVDTIPWFHFQDFLRGFFNPISSPVLNVQPDNSFLDMQLGPADISLLADVVLKTSVSSSEGSKTIEQLLVAAATRGNSDQAQLFLELGADPESAEPTFPHQSVIQIAAQRHDKHLMAALLKKKADPNKHSLPTEEFKSPLACALVSPGGFDVVELLVEAGADVNCGYSFPQIPIFHHDSYRQRYPLEQAVANGELDCAEFLIEAGASLEDPWTLRTAIERSDEEMTKLLLGAGVNINDLTFRKHGQQTNLELVLEFYEPDCAQLLIESGAHVHPGDIIAMIKYDKADLFDTLVRAGLNANIPQLGIMHTSPAQSTSSIGQMVPHFSIKILLDNSASPDKRDPFLPTPLQQACKDFANNMRDHTTQRELIDILLEFGADINATPATMPRARPPLQSAIRAGDLSLIIQLIDYGSKIHNKPAASRTINTYLETALLSRNPALVEFLIAKEPSIERDYKNSQSAFYIAAWSGNLKLVDWVLGLCTKTAHWMLQSAIEAASQTGQSIVVRRLLDMGVDIKEDTTPLLCLAIEIEDKELLDLLLAGAADLTSYQSHISPLLIAIRREWPYAVRSLLDLEISFRQKSYFNVGELEALPLLEAVEESSAQCIEMLLESEIKVYNCNVSDCLEIAISNHATDIVRLLLLHGADPNHLSPGSDLRPIHLAARECFFRPALETLKLLISYGTNANAYSVQAGYPLQMADVDACQILLEAGACFGTPLAPPPAATTFLEGHLTELQRAAGSGNIAEVHLLIANGEDVNEPAADNRGMTALQYASIKGHFSIVALLLQNGANTMAPAAAIGGRMALAGAAENGRLDIIQLLIENDSEPGSLKARCETAAVHAEQEGHKVIADILRIWDKE
ncbi:ankyrin repeat [Fusarium beomiforme]|uniref:Ankyrin repeat n=1 Tax=Fusarium beomiforme TaxID=44412 RepID=A0A9P5DYH6_9HYPO|nr:ankyrin repeat [Fusarium beomiforme]